MDYKKYEKQYHMPPVVTYDWVKKEQIEKYECKAEITQNVFGYAYAASGTDVCCLHILLYYYQQIA